VLDEWNESKQTRRFEATRVGQLNLVSLCFSRAVKMSLRLYTHIDSSIRALGTSGVVGPEKELFPFVADLMDNNPDFVEEFKPQELSNTIW
jgi:hypothetical protein